MINKVATVLTKIKEKTPLVHVITNYVTINDCANVLLSYGASPAMVEAYDEAYDFAKISNCVYLNLGSLTKEQEQAMAMAIIGAKNNNVPVVLDPVGCGAIKRKVSLIDKLHNIGNIGVIKGNMGEIKFLAGFEGKNRGVDSIDDGSDAKEAAIALSKKYNCTVVATGKEDIVTDGERTAVIKNNCNMLTLVTGSGCMVGALNGATIAVEEDVFIASVCSVLSMNIAGENASKKSNGPGSFKVNLIDEIYDLTEEKIKKEGNVVWL